MSTVSTRLIPEETRNDIVSAIATSCSVAKLTYVPGDTDLPEGDTLGASMPAEMRYAKGPRGTDFQLARAGAIAVPFGVPPNRALIMFLAEWRRFEVEQDLTRPFDAKEIQAMTTAGREEAETSSAPLPGSLPGWVRLPEEAVRVAERDDTITLKWDPLDYEVTLAIEKYFQQDDANPDRS